MATLNLVSGVTPGKKFELGVAESVIGRSSECQVSIDVAAVSRRHAVIQKENEHFFIRDLGSRNKTFLNGQAIEAVTPLRNGDRILICDQEFVFHQEPAGGLLGGVAASAAQGHDESSLAQIINDDPEDTLTSVIATLDLSPGTSGLAVSANPEAKLAALVEISNSLGKAISVEEVLPKLLDSLFKIFVQADRAFVVMRPQPDAPLVPIDWRRRRGDCDEAPRLSRTIIEKAMSSRQAIRSADAASDDRFGMAQSIAEFKIRSMMCAPMVNSDGESFGAIQIDTTNQRSHFGDDDLEVLAGVAAQAAVAVDNAKLHEQMLAQRALQRDLDLAARMQRALLPSSDPRVDGYQFFSYYESARQVGGDYYDYIPLPGGRFAVVVGDVAGKGVSAAILMARLSSDVRFSLATEPDLTSAVMRINKSFAQQGWQDRFVTMIFCIVDPATHEMTMVNAGHMAPLLRNSEGRVIEIGEEIAGLPIGVYDEFEYESMARTLEPGDVITIFTDGFSEAMNPNQDLYGLERLANIAAAAAENTEQLGEHILTDVQEFVSGHPQSDDMCLACFGRNPS
ncbi:MAG: SpoIIE family protein phosphatase [Planctomycetales bacterium]|nr:SpoIIE family protein phosphatase [Planctomycetales bacterium]